MNDITALAQRMKAAAEKLDGDTWHDEGASVYGGAYDVGDTVCYDHIVDCENVNGESLVAEFIAVANPANVKTLVEALEAGDTENERMARDLISRNGEIEGLRKRVEELEKIATDYGMKFQRAQDDLKKKALMESRAVTVKLPEERFRYGESDYDDGFVNGWNAHGIETRRSLTAAGIQVIEGDA